MDNKTTHLREGLGGSICRESYFSLSTLLQNLIAVPATIRRKINNFLNEDQGMSINPNSKIIIYIYKNIIIDILYLIVL